MSFVCSSNDVGIPVGRSGSATSSCSLASAPWMRCSISRTESKYSSSFVLSPAPTFEAKRRASSRTESRMLLVFLIRASRSALLPPSPNSRSNTSRGWFSVRFGVVSLRHETVFT